MRRRRAAYNYAKWDSFSLNKISSELENCRAALHILLLYLQRLRPGGHRVHFCSWFCCEICSTILHLIFQQLLVSYLLVFFLHYLMITLFLQIGHLGFSFIVSFETIRLLIIGIVELGPKFYINIVKGLKMLPTLKSISFSESLTMYWSKGSRSPSSKNVSNFSFKFLPTSHSEISSQITRKYNIIKARNILEASEFSVKPHLVSPSHE